GDKTRRNATGQQVGDGLGRAAAVGYILNLNSRHRLLQMHQTFALRLPRAALAPLVTNIDDALWRLIPGSTGALELLVSYLGVLGDDEALATPELRRLVVTQIHDLAALAIGATRDAAVIAEGGGVRAARLRAVKSDIVANLGDCTLTISAVAQRQRATT